MLFTCEQVSGGHPDKICDQISDAIVTDCLKHDRNSRVAVECMIKGYEVNIAGEITSKHDPDCRALARHVLFNYCAYEDLPRYNITVNLTRQSPDIAQGVDGEGDKKLGAGDQGMMFGYATSETREMLPLPYVLACEALERLRDCGAPCLRPDAKCQVTFDYGKHRIDTFLISTQHAEDASTEDVYNIVAQVMKDTAKRYGLNTDFKVLVNPTGRFVIGGSFADTGVTGRKIIADTYGGVCRHGGGAFSGKDPTKVDRSASYMARHLACKLLDIYQLKWCEVQLGYAIGIAEPVSIVIKNDKNIPLEDYVRENHDLTPLGIIEKLNLIDRNYELLAEGCHYREALV